MSFKKALYATAVVAVSQLALSSAYATDTITVAVAANFSATASTIAQNFVSYYADLGQDYSVNIVSNSTGVLASAISSGTSGYDLFLAADDTTPAALLSTASATVTGSAFNYAEGYMELLTYPNSGVTVTSGLPVTTGTPYNTLTNSLVIANPSTAPYGVAADEVLTNDYNVSTSDSNIHLASNITAAYTAVWTNKTYKTGFVARSAICTQSNGVKNFGVYTDYHYSIEPTTGSTRNYTDIMQAGLRVVNSNRTSTENTELDNFISYLRDSTLGGATIIAGCYTVP